MYRERERDMLSALDFTYSSLFEELSAKYRPAITSTVTSMLPLCY